MMNKVLIIALSRSTVTQEPFQVAQALAGERIAGARSRCSSVVRIGRGQPAADRGDGIGSRWR